MCITRAPGVVGGLAVDLGLGGAPEGAIFTTFESNRATVSTRSSW